MFNPFLRDDTYFKNGVSFKRRITGKEFGSSLKNFFKVSWSKANFIYIFLVVLLIYIFSTIRYFNWAMFTGIFTSTIMVGIVAVGMGLIILLGEIDLSVGSMYALSIILAIFCYNSTIVATGNTLLGFFVCLIVAIFSGVIFGFINGFFIGILKMPSFIVTLATMLIYRSVGQYIGDVVRTNADTSSWVNGSIFNMLNYGPNFNNWVRELGVAQWAAITLPTLLFILTAVLIWAMTKYTKFGRKIYAVGSNPKAAGLVGIKSNWMKTIVFSIAGALVGFAAFLHIATRGNVDCATSGNSYELYAIASVVLGGIAMSGGRGTIIGVIFGAAAFQTIDKIIAALNLNPFLNDAIKGGILIVAILLQVIHFDKQFYVSLLQKLNVIFTPNKDLILEAKYKTECENLEKLYTNKINKVNHSKLSEEEIAAKINGLLDEKEAKLLDLKNKYDVLIEKAKVEAKVHDEKEELKAKIETKKHEILNQKQYDIYLLNNKKKELSPWQGDYYKYEKHLSLEHAKLAYNNNQDILEYKSRFGMDAKQIESLREFILPYAGENKDKINAEYDAKLAKYNAYQEKINQEKVKLEASNKDLIEKLNNSYDAKIEKAVSKDEQNNEQYKVKKQSLEQKEKDKLALKEQKVKDKADRKAQKEALKAENNAHKEEVEKQLNKRLETIIKNRKK